MAIKTRKKLSDEERVSALLRPRTGNVRRVDVKKLSNEQCLARWDERADHVRTKGSAAARFANDAFTEDYGPLS
jgi:hypothetical protein